MSRSEGLTASMPSITERDSKLRRMSVGVAPPERARASIAFFAERYSRYDGTSFMPKIATRITMAKTKISPIRLRPCCVLRADVLRIFLPLLRSAERSEPPEVVQVQPNEEGLADDIFVRDESPDAAVARIVPVVAHHEVVPRWDGAHEAAAIVVAIAARRPSRHHRRRGVVVDKDLVLRTAERLDEAPGKLHALARQVIVHLPLRHFLPVDGQALVAVFDTVAGQADDALDVVE